MIHRLRTDDFNYELPGELIAAEPPAVRGESRLLVVHRETGQIEHRNFADLPTYLRPGDVVVVNDSKVMRARLRGRRASTSGSVELLLLRREATASGKSDNWAVLARPARKLQPGEKVLFAGDTLEAEVLEVRLDGERLMRFNTNDLLPWLDRIGEMPLPPYIVQRRRTIGTDSELPEDAERYQTVYAQAMGSVAAPTAGLHFSTELLDQLEQSGIEIVQVTLHVGAGTFKPVEVEEPTAHPMHTEVYTIPAASAEIINRARADGRRIIAVGTTVVRTLESAAAGVPARIEAGSTSTQLLLLPGSQFKMVDVLVTNFHLPRSTLLMLVSAFASTDLIKHAYNEAITHHYRFYSYGDAMLVL